METIDDEITAATIDFIRRQNKRRHPVFRVDEHSTHMHLYTHTKPESVGAGRDLLPGSPNTTTR